MKHIGVNIQGETLDGEVFTYYKRVKEDIDEMGLAAWRPTVLGRGPRQADQDTDFKESKFATRT